MGLLQDSKTTFVTVNLTLKPQQPTPFDDSKTTFVTVNLCYCKFCRIQSHYSKTTFVTVNLIVTVEMRWSKCYSKTTFVTVNHISCSKFFNNGEIQKQPLLLLIDIVADIIRRHGKFKNNLCYC